jgi:hypothetical protein
MTFTLKRETQNWDAARRLVMIHVAMKFGPLRRELKIPVWKNEGYNMNINNHRKVLCGFTYKIHFSACV